MPQLLFNNLFKKKQISEEYKKIQKVPKKQQKRAIELLNEYNNGNILEIEDN